MSMKCSSYQETDEPFVYQSMVRAVDHQEWFTRFLPPSGFSLTVTELTQFQHSEMEFKIRLPHHRDHSPNPSLLSAILKGVESSTVRSWPIGGLTGGMGEGFIASPSGFYVAMESKGALDLTTLVVHSVNRDMSELSVGCVMKDNHRFQLNDPNSIQELRRVLG